MQSSCWPKSFEFTALMLEFALLATFADDLRRVETLIMWAAWLYTATSTLVRCEWVVYRALWRLYSSKAVMYVAATMIVTARYIFGADTTCARPVAFGVAVLAHCMCVHEMAPLAQEEWRRELLQHAYGGEIFHFEEFVAVGG
jgi:hypothetical protein